MLGGVEIPGTLSLEGHSDADVLLHALSDAVLGSVGLADIGTFFSDQDQKNKNLDSSLILLDALERMKQAGYRLSNIDVTVIGEKPRLSPHRARVLSRLSELTGLPEDRIGLKATTTEKMGALGRSEGVGCMASILVVKD